MPYTLSHRRNGAMLLLVVLIMGSTALLIAMSTALNGIGEMDMGLGDAQSAEALAIADGCAQEALLRLSRASSYTGAVLSVGDGSCTIAVSDVGGDKDITVTSILDRWERVLSIRVRVSGSRITILSWRQDA